MVYTAPNPITFTFSNGAYTAPNPLLFDYSIGSTRFTITPSAVMVATRNRAIIGGLTYHFTQNATLNRHFHIDGTLTVNNVVHSIREFTINDGGRLNLVSNDNYTPFEGDQIWLQSVTGNWVVAREVNSTTTIATVLKGAATVITEEVITSASTAIIDGSLVIAGDELPTTTASIYLAGASINNEDTPPIVTAFGEQLRSLQLNAVFEQPTLSWSVSLPSNELNLLSQIPTLNFVGSCSEFIPFSMYAEFTGMRSSISWSMETPMGLDQQFVQPYMVGTILEPNELTLSEVFPDIEPSILVMGGGMLSMNITMKVASAIATIGLVDSLEMNYQVSPPEMVGEINSGFGLSAILPGFTLTVSENEAFNLSAALVSFTPTINFTSGCNLVSEIPAMVMTSLVMDNNLSGRMELSKLSYTANISGGLDNSLVAICPNLIPTMQILSGETVSFSMAGLSPTFSGRASSVTTLALDSILPDLQFYAGQTGLSMNKRFPHLSHNLSINGATIGFL